MLVFGVTLFLMPFYDRSKRRDLSQRPVFATIGSILITEFIALTVWGYLTPGQIIPNYQAILLLGAVAVVTAAAVLSVYRLRGKTKATISQAPTKVPNQSTPIPTVKSKVSAQRKKRFIKEARNAGETVFSKFTAVFAGFLVFASVSLASLVNSATNILGKAPFFVGALAVFVVSSFFMCLMLRKFVLAYEGAAAK